jgi:flagellar hook protein FlgE
MSFQQGLSGLAAAAAALDVIGNNVANASTVGFKSSNANFSDVFAASLGIVGASQVGARRLRFCDPATVHSGQSDDHQQ